MLAKWQFGHNRVTVLPSNKRDSFCGTIKLFLVLTYHHNLSVEGNLLSVFIRGVWCYCYIRYFFHINQFFSALLALNESVSGCNLLQLKVLKLERNGRILSSVTELTNQK